MSGDDDEYRVALRVGRVFQELGIEYVLGGSLASSLLGEPRSTNDIDFAVRLKESDIAPLAAALGPDFSVDQEGLREAVRTRRSCNLFFLPTVLKIDLFVRGGRPFDDSELARKTWHALGEGGGLFVATLADNVLRKLLWFQMGGEVSDRQWRDILGMLRAGRGEFEHNYTSEWANRLGVADLLARALAQSKQQ